MVRGSQLFYSSFAFGFDLGICETHKYECNKTQLLWYDFVRIRNKGMVRIRIIIELIFISNFRGLPILNLMRYDNANIGYLNIKFSLMLSAPRHGVVTMSAFI